MDLKKAMQWHVEWVSLVINGDNICVDDNDLRFSS